MDKTKLITRYVEELNKRNFSVIDELVSEDVLAPGIEGREQYRKQIEERIKKFPDYFVKIDKIEEGGDQVKLFWTRTGNSAGGEVLNEEAVSTYKIIGGRIVEVI